METEPKRQEAIYLMEQNSKQERKMVQARGWEWDGVEDEDEDEEWDEEYGGNCDWVTGWMGKDQQKLGLR